MTLRKLSFVLALMAAGAVRSADPAGPRAAAPGDKPKAGSLTVEEADEAETTPLAPTGEEKRAIGDYIRNNSGDIQECYAKRLQEKPRLQGKLVAHFDIGPSGRVIGVIADGVPDRELVACVVAVVRKWEFEKPASGGKLRIAYPWKFEPQPAR